MTPAAGRSTEIDEGIEVRVCPEAVDDPPGHRRHAAGFEGEKGRLKRIVADLSLEKDMLQDLIHRTLTYQTAVPRLADKPCVLRATPT